MDWEWEMGKTPPSECCFDSNMQIQLTYSVWECPLLLLQYCTLAPVLDVILLLVCIYPGFLLAMIELQLEMFFNPWVWAALGELLFWVFLLWLC